MAHSTAAAAVVGQFVANLDPSVQQLLQLLYESHIELERKLAKKTEAYSKLLQEHEGTKQELEELKGLVSKHLPMLRNRLSAAATHANGTQPALVAGHPAAGQAPAGPAQLGGHTHSGFAGGPRPVSNAVQPTKSAKRQRSADAGRKEGRASTPGNAPKRGKQANTHKASPPIADPAIAAAIAAAAAATQEALDLGVSHNSAVVPFAAAQAPAPAHNSQHLQGGTGAGTVQQDLMHIAAVAAGFDAGLQLLGPAGTQLAGQQTAQAEFDTSALSAAVMAFLQQHDNTAQHAHTNAEGAGAVKGSDGGSAASGFHPAIATAAAVAAGLQQLGSQQLAG